MRRLTRNTAAAHAVMPTSAIPSSCSLRVLRWSEPTRPGGVSKQRAAMRGFFDPRDEAIEVMIKKMFEQARGDCRPQVLVFGWRAQPGCPPLHSNQVIGAIAHG